MVPARAGIRESKSSAVVAGAREIFIGIPSFFYFTEYTFVLLR
jgi:hypothetical protein